MVSSSVDPLPSIRFIRQVYGLSVRLGKVPPFLPPTRPIEFLGSSDNPSTSLLPTPPVKKDRITSSSSSHESSDDDDDDLFTNTNHQQEIFVDSASSSEEESN